MAGALVTLSWEGGREVPTLTVVFTNRNLQILISIMAP